MTLMVRSANARQNVIAEAHARLRIMRKETEVVAGIWTAGSVERPGPEPADNAGRGTGE
ncbi:MAG: Kef-type K+ transport systems, predicted NAD-binding component [uncultured Paraburkholderia sp.]|nr:MAG: Kef-type K+ transport systems, predicted NAD-binding component [uncultured Paraburkholderia sp.]CAH2943883.1 MAG: Kef-type K+ transport systems, predicted NAD-binding component [uncultured Paraburkholderia sp.]